MKVLTVAILAFAMSSSAPHAQTWLGPDSTDGTDDKAVRVIVNIQVMTPVDQNAVSANLAGALTQANQPLSDLIGHQCEIIAAALKGTCKVVQLSIGSNVNSRMPMRPGQQQMISANANATFVVEPATAK